MSGATVTDVTDEGCEVQVTVVKENGACGFKLAWPQIGTDPDRFIYTVEAVLFPNAATCLCPGDRLLEVNDIPLADLNPAEVKMLFRQSPSDCRMKLFRPTVYSDLKAATKHDEVPWVTGASEREREGLGIVTKVKVKKSNGTLGITVTSFKNPRDRGLSSENNFYISGIRLARTARYLCVGDKLLKINGEPVDGLSHSEVIRKLTQSPEVCHLEVSRSSVVSVPDSPPPSYDELRNWSITS